MLQIAQSGEALLDFRPYVPAVDERGVVCFQAAVPGGSGVFAGDGGELVRLDTGEGGVVSHPDRNSEGTVCYVGELAPGRQTLTIVRDGQVWRTPEVRAFSLGPTMNEAGDVAFRVQLRDREGVRLARQGELLRVADTRWPYQEFYGLPVVDEAGAVVFRAALRSGAHAILSWRDGVVTSVVETGERFQELARFPSVNNRGEIAFAALRRDGSQGIFLATGSNVECVVQSAAFASFRGALVNDRGTIVFLATPHDGELGIYAGSRRLLGVGDALMGSAVAELALNPVSFNHQDQLAVRVRLADETQRILRLDIP